MGTPPAAPAAPHCPGPLLVAGRGGTGLGHSAVTSAEHAAASPPSSLGGCWRKSPPGSASAKGRSRPGEMTAAGTRSWEYGDSDRALSPPHNPKCHLSSNQHPRVPFPPSPSLWGAFCSTPNTRGAPEGEQHPLSAPTPPPCSALPHRTHGCCPHPPVQNRQGQVSTHNSFLYEGGTQTTQRAPQQHGAAPKTPDGCWGGVLRVLRQVPVAPPGPVPQWGSSWGISL